MSKFLERYATMAICIGLASLTLAMFTAGYLRHFHGGFTYEFCHYAEIASNLLNGKGYSTQTFYPSELAFLEQTGVNAAAHNLAPVAFRFPLFAFWSAFWMKLAGQTDFAMALGNGVAHAGWVCTLFLVGRRIANLRVALVAALLWAVQPLMSAGFDLSGHPDVLFGWLFLIHTYLFWRSLENSESQSRAFLLTGIIGGLCFLTRQNFAFWLPLLIFALIRFTVKTYRTRATLSYMLGLAVVAAPWFIYYWTHFHRLTNPLIFHELADSTVVLQMPWLEYRVFGWDLSAHTGFAKALAWKFQTYLGRSLLDLFTIWLQPIFFPLFLIAIAVKSTPQFSFTRFCALLLAWQLLLFAFLRHESMGLLTGRYFLWFAPIVLLGAMTFVDGLSARPKRQWTMLASVCALPLIYWAAVFVYAPSRHSHYPTGADVGGWEEITYIKESTQPSDWIATNIPTQITWYANRPTVNIPNTLNDFDLLLGKYPIAYVFISNQAQGEPDNYPNWHNADTELPRMGFDVERSFPGGVLLKRRAIGYKSVTES